MGKTPKIRCKSKAACTNCKNAHAACEDQRPCTRCVSKGIADTCKDMKRVRAITFQMSNQMNNIINPQPQPHLHSHPYPQHIQQNPVPIFVTPITTPTELIEQTALPTLPFIELQFTLDPQLNSEPQEQEQHVKYEQPQQEQAQQETEQYVQLEQQQGQEIGLYVQLEEQQQGQREVGQYVQLDEQQLGQSLVQQDQSDLYFSSPLDLPATLFSSPEIGEDIFSVLEDPDSHDSDSSSDTTAVSPSNVGAITPVSPKAADKSELIDEYSDIIADKMKAIQEQMQMINAMLSIQSELRSGVEYPQCECTLPDRRIVSCNLAFSTIMGYAIEAVQALRPEVGYLFTPMPVSNKFQRKIGEDVYYNKKGFETVHKNIINCEVLVTTKGSYSRSVFIVHGSHTLSYHLQNMHLFPIFTVFFN